MAALTFSVRWQFFSAILNHVIFFNLSIGMSECLIHITFSSEDISLVAPIPKEGGLFVVC